MEQYDGPLFDCDNAPLDALVATGSGTERVRGIGHTSWVLAQRPSMGVMLNL